MDAYQRYGRPPPPPPPPQQPPHLPQQQYQPPPQPQWYSSSPGQPYQQQYQPQQWAPPPPPQPFPLQQQQQYPPQHTVYHQVQAPPQQYPPVNQEWGNPSWAHHQAWDYAGHNKKEEDLEARARAWAAAKAAMDHQQPPVAQPQFNPSGVRLEGQAQFQEQYSHAIDPAHLESQAQSQSYQQQFHPPPEPVLHQQAPALQNPYAPDAHQHYFSREGNFAGDGTAVYSHQHPNSASPSVNQQEVPSSYSTITGSERAADQNELPYKSLPLPVTSFQEAQPLVQSTLPTFSGSELMKHPVPYGNKAADPNINLADKPLDFIPRFNHNHETQVQSMYPHLDSSGPIRGLDPVVSAQSWTPPLTSGGVYPPIPPGHPPGPPHDHSMTVPAAPIFGGISGPSFPPAVPSLAAPFGLGAGASSHSSTIFPVDAYGISSASDRPKKASVPNWLREEIIKKTVVMATSAQVNPDNETQSVEEENVDKFRGRGDLADNRSVESYRSTEDEEDDEVYVEAAKTAAINKEIKRILTEVLLKVTDDLFDEIATKVLNEDNLTVEGDSASNRNAFAPTIATSPSAAADPIPTASARVLVSVKPKESGTGNVSEKSPGDVLGLGSYASDDEDNDDVRTQKLPNTMDTPKNPSMGKHSVDSGDTVENGSSQRGNESIVTSLGYTGKTSPNGVQSNENAAPSLKAVARVAKDDKHVDGKFSDRIKNSSRNNNVGGNFPVKPELPIEIGGKKMVTADSQSCEIIGRSQKENGKSRTDRKEDNHGNNDEKNLEKVDVQNGSKDKKKEISVQPEEASKESYSKRKTSRVDAKEDRKEKERGERSSVKEDKDNGKKRERGKGEKDDRSRHKVSSESGRHKRARSPSPPKRARSKRDNLSAGHANDSSDEDSEDSKRESYSRRRHKSPSPARSKRRQVSRSPHNKHSQRRHSPYSSLETTRRRRSRSRSLIRRQK